MTTHADMVIDALGGTSAVAREIEAPSSTVHSWRKMGIPASRLAHLRLLAQVKGVDLPEPSDEAIDESPDNAASNIVQVERGSPAEPEEGCVCPPPSPGRASVGGARPAAPTDYPAEAAE